MSMLACSESKAHASLAKKALNALCLRNLVVGLLQGGLRHLHDRLLLGLPGRRKFMVRVSDAYMIA